MKLSPELLGFLRAYVSMTDQVKCTCGWGSMVPVSKDCVVHNYGLELRKQLEHLVGYKKDES